MAVQTLLSFSQSTNWRPHNQSVTSSSQSRVKIAKGKDEELFDWNRNIQPLTPPPSEVGSPMSDSICEDSAVETSFNEDCESDEMPEKSSSLLKEVIVYDQSVFGCYLELAKQSILAF